MTNRTVGGLLLVFSIAALAPDYRGRMQGMITDPMNAAITQAAVRIQSTTTKTATACLGVARLGEMVQHGRV